MSNHGIYTHQYEPRFRKDDLLKDKKDFPKQVREFSIEITKEFTVSDMEPRVHELYYKLLVYVF